MKLACLRVLLIIISCVMISIVSFGLLIRNIGIEIIDRIGSLIIEIENNEK